MKKWYISYCTWVEGDSLSREPNTVHNLVSLEECKKAARETYVNKRAGYTFQYMTAHGPEGERVNLLGEVSNR